MSRFLSPSGRGLRSERRLAVVVATVVLVASLVPVPVAVLSRPTPGIGADTVLHTLGYAGLAAALLAAFDDGDGDGMSSSLRVAALAFALAVAFGVGVEFLQAAVPWREFEVADMAADALGAGVVVLGWWLRQWVPL